MKKFDLINTPLDGTNLIEASAGTGKTYAIAGIFLRLILEKGLSVEKILVVTFTIAAAAELRTRIRDRLRAARDIFSSPESFPPENIDELTAALLKKFSGEKRESAVRDLTAALSGFDGASICTIHSFCGEALSVHAFESGALFTTEISPDSSPYIKEASEDYWRTVFYTLPDSAVKALAAAGVTPDTFSTSIKARGIGDIKILPDEKFPSAKKAAAALSRLQKTYEDAAAFWSEHIEKIRENILTAKENKGNKTIGFQTQHLDSRTAANSGYFAGGDPLAGNKLEFFTSDKINLSAFDPGSSAAVFAGIADTLTAEIEPAEDLFSGFMKSLQVKSVEFAEKRLPEIKRKRDIRVYDDLITDTRRALLSPSGGALARALRSRFSAALIDEFQDTDPAQYDIFTKIFGVKGSILFQIGDPKQAIYSFRGADIFSYIKASKDAQKRYTLGVNHRSHPSLVRSVNSLFGRPYNPFLFKDIPFEPVDPSTENFDELIIDSQKAAPLRFYMLPPGIAGENTKGFLGKTDARDAAASITAAEISRLLDAGLRKKALIGNRPVYPSDIAVLVRTHFQADSVKKKLAAAGIPSVIYGERSVFSTEQAEEILAVMRAVINPKNPALVKRALATLISGKTSDYIELFNSDDTERNEAVSRFSTYRDEWAASGFMSMMQMLLAGEGTRKRALSLENGERILTDILHISELLHSFETAEDTGMERLTARLAEKIYSSGEAADEEYQMRLETDEMAVKIVTVHASKGLQYPVVYIPFGWDSSVRGFNPPKKLHDPDTREPLLVLAEPSDEAELTRLTEASVIEDLAEEVRLLYVAVTRAKYMVNIFWGKIALNSRKNPPPYTSALAWVLHGEGELKNSGDISSLDDILHNYTFEKIREETAARASDAGAEILTAGEAEPVKYSPYDGAAGEKLSVRKFSGTIERAFSLFSYTGLFSARSDEKTAEIETLPRPEPPPRDAAAPFLFPKGARAGLCVHHLFENTLAAGPDRNNPDTAIASSLAAYGFSEEWAAALKEIYLNTINTPIPAGDKKIILSSVDFSRMKAELEFSFPAEGITPEAVENIVRTEPSGNARGYDHGMTAKNGYMRGFIDLIFEHEDRYYILDWKSNHLGWTVDDYSPLKIAAAMRESGYDLQYHIYTAALDRFLKFRLREYNYEKHFGGVLYLFVRGISPSTGVFFDRPSPDMTARLNTYFEKGGG